MILLLQIQQIKQIIKRQHKIHIILKKQNKGCDVEDEMERTPPGKLGQVMKLAQEFGVPILDRERNELWSPE